MEKVQQMAQEVMQKNRNASNYAGFAELMDVSVATAWRMANGIGVPTAMHYQRLLELHKQVDKR